MAADTVTAAAPWYRRLWTMLRAAGKEFGHDQSGRLAAALSYYTIFSLVPLLFVAVAVTAITVGPSPTALPTDCSTIVDQPLDSTSDRPLDRLVVQLHDIAGEDVSDPVRILICTARRNASTSLSIGLAVAAFAASGIFLQVQGVLNRVFHVPDEKAKGILGWIYKRLVALASALALALLVFTPVLAVGAVQFVGDIIPDDLSWLRTLVGFGVPLLSLVILVGVIGLTFQALTAAKIPWKAARRGGAFTAVVGLGAAFGVGTYLGRVVPNNATFGALGGIAVLLFFFNLMWIVYVFGAELTKVYADYLEFGDVGAPSAREASRFSDAPPLEAPPVVESQSLIKVGLFAFFVGLILGWRRRE